MAAITGAGVGTHGLHLRPKNSISIIRYSRNSNARSARSIVKTLGAADDGYGGWAGSEAVTAKPQTDGLRGIIEQGEFLTKQAESEAADELLAQSVGMHIRGRTVVTEGQSTNEDDDKRYYWHRRLHACAEQGDFTQAEAIIRQMRETGHLPGPRAHHALIFSYVKGSNPLGALDAIRNEVAKGIQPLPQTYTAVVHGFLQEGDVETAEAVYASNRRAGVSSEKSWTAICTALFNAAEHERALKLLDQASLMASAGLASGGEHLGEEEGMVPDKRLYEAMIKSFCRRGDLISGLRRLQEMQAKGLQPDKDHISALVTAHALAGKAYEAEKLLIIMLKASGTSTAATIGAINALLQMYLKQQLPCNELAEKITSLRQSMVKGGLALDRKGYSLLLEASTYLEDPQIGLLAFMSLKSQGRGGLQYATDEVLGEFLLQLSLSKQPVELYEVLTVMSREQRNLSEEMMPLLEDGRSFLTAWLSRSDSTDESKEGGESRNELLVIDGISLDSQTLCAVGEDFVPLGPTKMSVKALRAELAARQCPLRGNKKELIKQLQKARAEANVAGASYDDGKGSKVKKVEIIVSEESWGSGNLVASNTYEDERDSEAADDDEENDDRPEGEEEEEDENASNALSLEDDDDFDYDDRVYAMLKAQGKFNVDNLPQFTNKSAGVREALAIFNGVIAMGGLPAPSDVAVLWQAVVASANGSYAEQLIKTLQKIDMLNDERKASLEALMQPVEA